MEVTVNEYPLTHIRQLREGGNPAKYRARWLDMFRGMGYATQDDSWGELEKILNVVHRNHIQFQRGEILRRLSVGGCSIHDVEEMIASLGELDDKMQKYKHLY